MKISIDKQMQTVKYIILFLFMLESVAWSSANNRTAICDTIQKDTLYRIDMGEVLVTAKRKKRRKYYRDTYRYKRMVRNIRIVYPYAKEANKTILEINEQLKSVKNKRERRRIIRKKYKGLMRTYKKPLMRLKISQGKVLMKLIDRESGNCSYYHIKELRGSFTAVFWQSIARLFGSSLKSKYDPLGKDWMMEEILERMRKGEIPPPQKLETIRKAER